MPKRHFFLQVFLPFFLLLLASSVLLVLYTNRSVKKLYLDEVKSHLTALANIALDASANSSEVTTHLDSLATHLGTASTARFTFIDLDGVVIGDSHQKSTLMENHFDRPEIRDAISGNVGVAIRHSPTLNQNMMYLALPRRGGVSQSFIARVSLPITVIETGLSDTFLSMELGWLAIFLAVSGLTLLIAKRVTKPLLEMQQIAARFTNGELNHRIPMPSTVELARLADALNAMAAQLSARIAAVTERRNELEAILSSMVEGVIAVDNQDRILMVNRAVERLLGISSMEVVGRPMQEALRIPDLVEFITNQGESTDSFELELFLKGNPVVFLASRAMLFDARQTRIGQVIVLDDVSLLRKLETVRRDFVANVSHELRTPITSIKGSAETLADGALLEPEASKHFVEIILRNADRMNSLIEDLLSLARLEQEGTGKGLTLTEDSPLRIAQSAIELNRSMADSKEITIDLSGTVPQIKCNSQLLEEAVSNLIDNAIKYSNQGGKIEVKIAADAQEISIVVSDNGIGIENQHLGRLFERFYRVDVSRSRQAGGTGLGLAIVKHIALAHKGRVSVSSQSGAGSSFGIHLPVA